MDTDVSEKSKRSQRTKTRKKRAGVLPAKHVKVNENKNKVAQTTAPKQITTEKNPDKPVSRPPPDLTARGTPRVRRPKRSKEEMESANSQELVKLSGQIPTELRTAFMAHITANKKNQGIELTEIIEQYLIDNGEEPPEYHN